MGRNRSGLCPIRTAHSLCAGMVHWYVFRARAGTIQEFGSGRQQRKRTTQELERKSRQDEDKLTNPTHTVAYSLGIYLLNLFLAFISPKFDPSLETDTDMEDGMPAGQSSLPTKSDEEFKPFVRRLPEFKFWHSATRAICIAFLCSWSEIFNLPVFWPVLVVYWLILVFLTMRRQIQSMIKYR